MRRWLVLFFVCILVMGCGNDSLTRGGGTNVGDEASVVTGIIRDKNGPAAGALVRLNTVEFNPGIDSTPASQRYITGSDGKYVFEVAQKGVYNIEASQAELGTKALLKGIKKEGVKLNAAEMQIQSSGQIQIQLPDYFGKSSGHVYIPGTTYHSRVEAGVVVNSLSVPALDQMKIVYMNDKDGSKTTLVESISLPASSQIQVSKYNLWSNHMDVKINPALAGIALEKNVVNFPLLVRLNSGNFSFAKANANGADIRFTKADGVTPLSFEIERWNSALSMAEIWVKVDTLYADNRPQLLKMHFGNIHARSMSEPKQVFESTQGFRGVWHLGEDTTSSTVRDAAGNFPGILKAADQEILTSSVSTANIVGAGYNFKDWKNQHWIDLGADKNFINNASEVSLSLWVKTIIDTSHSPDVFSLSVAGSVSADPKSRLVLHFEKGLLAILARAVDTTEGMIGVTMDPGVNLEQWFYVSGVMNIGLDTMQVYVNGKLLISKKTDHTQFTMESGSSTHGAIGSNDIGNGNFFAGQMDEVRLETRARTADWVKLCYENQRVGQVLVTVSNSK